MLRSDVSSHEAPPPLLLPAGRDLFITVFLVETTSLPENSFDRDIALEALLNITRLSEAINEVTFTDNDQASVAMTRRRRTAGGVSLTVLLLSTAIFTSLPLSAHAGVHWSAF